LLLNEFGNCGSHLRGGAVGAVGRNDDSNHDG
jgi:hypothetical protein